MDTVGMITLPVRLGVRVASWGMRTAVGLLPLGDEDAPSGEREPRGPTVEEPPAPAATVVRPTPAPPPAPEPEPPHVDEGATVVAEFAEEGAEDGAGAQVDLNEPWVGYDRLHADELIDRLAAASDEALAAVLLYERSTRARPSVIDAAEEQLRARAPSGRT
jgi:hypothetical protein